MPSHFIGLVTNDGGPNPAEELEGLVNQSLNSENGHVAWFKNSLTDNQFELSGQSICIIFRRLPQGDKIEAVVARILKRDGFPAPDEIVSFYEPYRNLKQFWRLGGIGDNSQNPDLVKVEFESLDEIPGVSYAGWVRASQTFGNQASIAFWNFPENFNPLKWLRDFKNNDVKT